MLYFWKTLPEGVSLRFINLIRANWNGGSNSLISYLHFLKPTSVLWRHCQYKQSHTTPRDKSVRGCLVHGAFYFPFFLEGPLKSWPANTDINFVNVHKYNLVYVCTLAHTHRLIQRLERDGRLCQRHIELKVEVSGSSKTSPITLYFLPSTTEEEITAVHEKALKVFQNTVHRRDLREKV